jgi:hypothetical protein
MWFPAYYVITFNYYLIALIESFSYLQSYCDFEHYLLSCFDLKESVSKNGFYLGPQAKADSVGPSPKSYAFSLKTNKYDDG